MTKLVFVGSRGEGYRSGTVEQIGVYLSKDMYDKHEELVKEVFENCWFSELDGKHSETVGDLVVQELDGYKAALMYYQENDTYDGLDQFVSEVLEELYLDAEHNDKIIHELWHSLVRLAFHVSEENAPKVKAYVEQLESEFL